MSFLEPHTHSTWYSTYPGCLSIIHLMKKTLNPFCQLPCSQNCETRNFFAQNMPKTIDWAESQSTRAHWLESQSNRVLNVCPLTNGKLFGSSPIRLESQTSVCRPTLKLFGSSPSRLESPASVRQPPLKLFGSSPSRLSFDRRKNCWLTSQRAVPRPLQPLTTNILDVCYLPVTETKRSPIVCTSQNYNSNYVLIKLLTTYFITQWRFDILLVLSVVSTNLSPCQPPLTR